MILFYTMYFTPPFGVFGHFGIAGFIPFVLKFNLTLWSLSLGDHTITPPSYCILMGNLQIQLAKTCSFFAGQVSIKPSITSIFDKDISFSSTDRNLRARTIIIGAVANILSKRTA